ncbi:hypothetical protein PYH37_003978 [Sinorhizobium numidicum]|uniref:Lipopolysaccharide assembly protein A domain-containing protein n=1 Tax=Sinorhizobium numidicum TaxID=680248 RepID=A0ABY8CUS6_9HYPH|nr:hypothetical protein [Sinorhizobium numidicum]WEX79005.1 hypothetical protein PYH37_003978 [Sinorhizobium numidicum]WEX82401.1 hypothetical protein PYH38_004690 [Sinorhizobium numidicum]
MGKFLEILGGIVTIGTLALTATTLTPLDIRTLLTVLPWAFPAIAGGLILVAFGAMLDHLAAIRTASERQAEIFQQLLDRRAPSKKE